MDSPLDVLPVDDGRSVAFGRLLRQARERRGLTLQEIAQETKIPWRHLEALEHGNLSAVPRGPYRRAETRAFAKTVGLDQKLALAELDRALQGAGADVEPAATARPSRARAFLPPALALATVVVIALSGFAFWPRSAARQLSTPPSPPEGTRVASTPPIPTVAHNPEKASEPIVTPPTDLADDQPPPDVEGELAVITDPPGARLTIDGVGWGITPIVIRHLPLGAKRVRVTKDGFAGEERVVRLDEKRPRDTLQIVFATQPQ